MPFGTSTSICVRDDDPPLATAVGACLFHDLAGSAALGAGSLLDELAEDVLRDAADGSRPRAGRARPGGRARFRAARVAALARERDVERHADSRPGERLLELDLHHRLNVSPTPGAVLPSAGAAEEIVSEERCEDVRETPEVGEDRLEATSCEARLPEAVVGRSALGVGQHLERLGDVSEPPLRVGLGGDIGVELARERAERALDLGVARSARDA